MSMFIRDTQVGDYHVLWNMGCHRLVIDVVHDSVYCTLFVAYLYDDGRITRARYGLFSTAKYENLTLIR